MKELIGNKFNRMTVVEIDHARKFHLICECECGATKSVYKYNLIKNKIKSCGCLNNEKRIERSRSHGMSKTRVYHIWHGIIQRCKYPCKNYSNRGISVCEQWASSFECFYEDMGDPPSKFHSIDRIDNDGNYSPGNCRWATPEEQANNTRRNRLIVFNGETKTLSQWAKLSVCAENSFKQRIIKLNWPIEKAISYPDNAMLKSELFEIDGNIYTIPALAEKYNMTDGKLRKRLKRGWTITKAISTP